MQRRWSGATGATSLRSMAHYRMGVCSPGWAMVFSALRSRHPGAVLVYIIALESMWRLIFVGNSQAPSGTYRGPGPHAGRCRAAAGGGTRELHKGGSQSCKAARR
jgi:hypothetical protein